MAMESLKEVKGEGNQMWLPGLEVSSWSEYKKVLKRRGKADWEFIKSGLESLQKYVKKTEAPPKKLKSGDTQMWLPWLISMEEIAKKIEAEIQKETNPKVLHNLEVGYYGFFRNCLNPSPDRLIRRNTIFTPK